MEYYSILVVTSKKFHLYVDPVELNPPFLLSAGQADQLPERERCEHDARQDARLRRDEAHRRLPRDDALQGQDPHLSHPRGQEPGLQYSDITDM